MFVLGDPAPAVVPVLLGPLQALMLALPQVLLGLVLVASSLTNPAVWYRATASAWKSVRTKPLRCLGWLAVLAACAGLVWWALQPVEASSAGLEGPAARRGEAPTRQSRYGDGAWPTFHGSPDRCGVAGAARGHEKVFFVSPSAVKPEPRWRFQDALVFERRPFASSPAVAGSCVIVGSDNSKLYCLDLKTGRPRWAFEARWPIFSSPAVAYGRVFVGEGLHENTDSKFYCLDLATGKMLWRIQTTGHTESSPALADGKVYFGAGDDGVYCADAETGEIIWNKREGHVDCSPLVVGDRVFYGSGYVWEGVFCVDARDGETLWKKDLPGPSWGAPSYCDGRLYISVGNGNFYESAPNPVGEVRCLDPSDGSDIWRFTGVKDAVLTAVAVSGGLAVFGSRDGGCYCVDASTGEFAWRFDAGAPVLSSPAIAGGQVVFGADDDKLHCLDLRTGREQWSYDTIEDVMFFMTSGSIQSSPAVFGGDVIFCSLNGNVYCLGGEGEGGAAGGIAQAGYRSRLMWAADALIVGLLGRLARLTGSCGLAAIMTAVFLKLLLSPLDRRQTRQIRRMRDLQPTVGRMERDYVDYRVHRYELRELYAAQGIRPAGALLSVALQMPLFTVVFLILLATPVFAGRPFLWIGDLAAPDRLARIAWLPWLGPDLNLLPIVLVAAVLLLSVMIRAPGRRRGIAGRIAWPVLAVGLGVLTYRWPASLMLFTITLLIFGIVIHRVLLIWPRRAEPAGTGGA